ncbi:MAG: GNAT family N-acetyltransferase [Sulfuritalea sp.]|nr:GNAT family N-acetyltransferase [Sulfuritalea sp.]
MNLREGILELIRDEQRRQCGNFFPEDAGYLEKITSKAGIVSHDVEGKCLGFVFFYCNDAQNQSSYISLLLVSPEARKTGVGTALIRFVLALTQQRGFKVCRLEVRKDNTGAVNFYRSLGFRQIEDRGEKYLMEAAAN